MKPAARVTDLHTCPMVTGVVPHVGGPILPPGDPTTLIAGLPAARLGDMATCVGPPDTIVMGSSGCMIAGKPAARMGDQTAHGGIITLGCFTVLIGESGGGAGAPATMQAATMREAKASAKPFCEECARAVGGPPPSTGPQAESLRTGKAAELPFCEECSSANAEL